ncbi:chromosomal replication initiator protein DnaA [bacterium]|nr:chromosomal replication initiator protein DnaA [bacterium]
MTITNQEMQKLWDLVKFSLSKKFSPESYKAWIEHSTKLTDVAEGKVIVSVRNNLALQWLEKNAKEQLTIIFRDVLGEGNVSLEVNQDAFEAKLPIKDTIPKIGNLLSQVEEKEGKMKKALKDAGLNEKYTFETFVVGNNNQIAHAAAQAITQHIGQEYNPLFVYGSVGVGKTHLMHAIGHAVLDHDMSKKIFYCSSETFLNELVESIRSKKNAEFREKYRKLDILMIDDIQFISKWEAAQEEIFHTFNVLSGANKQIILASDRPPTQIQNLADRLRSRFEGGMMIDIIPPNYETRVAILANYNKEHSPPLSLECLETIAVLVEDNVRQLIGAYNKVYTYAKITNTPMDRETVEKIIGVDQEAARRKVSVEDILENVADAFGVTIGQMKSATRTAEVAMPRQIAMYLIRDILNYPLERVARSLKRNDHTTVIHAVEKVNKLMTNDHLLRTQIVGIKNSILK